MVNTDGTVYIEHEVRNSVDDVITSDTLYLWISGTGDIVLSTTTQDQALMPGSIIPDGNGGVLATWTVSPSHSVLPFPYQAADVTGTSVGTPYNLPFSPQYVAPFVTPTLVLGENGTVFASGSTTATIDGAQVAVDQIASFNVTSGATNWTYQAPAGSSLFLVGAAHNGGLLARLVSAVGEQLARFDSAGNLTLGSSGTQMRFSSVATSTLAPYGTQMQASWMGDLLGLASGAAAQFAGLAIDWADSPWAAPRGSPSPAGASVDMSWFPELDHCTTGGGCIGHFEAIYNALDDLKRRLNDPTISDLAQTAIFNNLGTDASGGKYTSGRLLSYLTTNRPRYYDGVRSTYCNDSLTNGHTCYKNTWVKFLLNGNTMKEKFADPDWTAATGTPGNPMLSFFRPDSIGYASLGENIGNESVIFHEALHGMTGLQDHDILDDLGMNSLTHPSCSITLRIQHAVLKNSAGLDQTDSWPCPKKVGDE